VSVIAKELLLRLRQSQQPPRLLHQKAVRNDGSLLAVLGHGNLEKKRFAMTNCRKQLRLVRELVS